jgi:hypothetical protein
MTKIQSESLLQEFCGAEERESALLLFRVFSAAL